MSQFVRGQRSSMVGPSCRLAHTMESYIFKSWLPPSCLSRLARKWRSQGDISSSSLRASKRLDKHQGDGCRVKPLPSSRLAYRNLESLARSLRRERQEIGARPQGHLRLNILQFGPQLTRDNAIHLVARKTCH